MRHLMILIIAAGSMLAAESPKPAKPAPITAEENERLLKLYVRLQAAQLQIREAQAESAKAEAEIRAEVEKLRNAHKAGAECSPLMDRSWVCSKEAK